MYIQYQYKTNLFLVDRYVLKHFLQLCIAVKSGMVAVQLVSVLATFVLTGMDIGIYPSLPLYISVINHIKMAVRFQIDNQ